MKKSHQKNLTPSPSSELNCNLSFNKTFFPSWVTWGVPAQIWKKFSWYLIHRLWLLSNLPIFLNCLEAGNCVVLFYFIFPGTSTFLAHSTNACFFFKQMTEWVNNCYFSTLSSSDGLLSKLVNLNQLHFSEAKRKSITTNLQWQKHKFTHKPLACFLENSWIAF